LSVFRKKNRENWGAGGISVDKIEGGFGRVRGPRGYVVVGTIIVVQVSSKLYGKFRCCDKQYLLFVVLCYEPGLPKFSGFVYVLLFLVVFCYRLSW
jgi:hypothetical protein